MIGDIICFKDKMGNDVRIGDLAFGSYGGLYVFVVIGASKKRIRGRILNHPAGTISRYTQTFPPEDVVVSNTLIDLSIKLQQDILDMEF
jgi:hypothetical protein